MSSRQSSRVSEETSTNNNPNASADAGMWEGFERIETDRFMYNPNNEGGAKLPPLVGYIINLIPMPTIRSIDKRTGEVTEKEWECFVVKTTRPTQALDREKLVVDVPVGKEVLIPATFQITQNFTRIATDEQRCFEVLISPKKKVKLATGGRTMWTWDLGANMKSVRPRSDFGPSAIIGNSSMGIVPSLPAKNMSAASDIVAEGTEVPTGATQPS